MLLFVTVFTVNDFIVTNSAGPHFSYKTAAAGFRLMSDAVFLPLHLHPFLPSPNHSGSFHNQDVSDGGGGSFGKNMETPPPSSPLEKLNLPIG